MHRRKVKGKQILSFSLACAMLVTSLEFSQIPVHAEEVTGTEVPVATEAAVSTEAVVDTEAVVSAAGEEDSLGEEITSISFGKTEVDITTQGAYAVAFDSLVINGGYDIKGSDLQTQNQLKWYIDPKGDGHFYELGKEGSGLTWDQNYGWDAAQPTGGFWFNPIKNTVVLRVTYARNSSVSADLKLVIDNTVGTKGTEYDFSKDNSAGDYADPGKTKDGYELVWADEFDGNYGSDQVDATTGLDLDNWSYQLGDGSEVGNPGWGNNEKQSYTSNKKNIAVNEDLNGDGNGDGLLRITASYEADGYANGDESTKDYTSARIRTSSRTNEALFTTTYGYIEGRMSLPGTQGAWPAFWMLPQSTDIYGEWPVSGEIDIMETCGKFTDHSTNAACGTLHWGVPDHVYKGSGYVDLATDYSYFHTYAVDWEPGKITWLYDGKVVNVLQNWESMISGTTDSLSYDAPFDQPYYLLLNLAVDNGQFGGAVNRATFQDDINMYVDYVRVFQKSEGYAESVNRTASDGIKDDWKQYEGVNQIAEVKTDNLVAGGFSSDADTDLSKWYLSSNANGTGGKANLTPVTDQSGKTWAKVNVTEAGSQDYSVQMIGHYNAKAGYLYQVSFDAYADGDMVGKTVNADSKEWQGWSANGIRSFELGSTPQKVAFTFEQKSDFDKCRIEFNLGSKSTGNVYLSNIKVEIVDPSAINSDAGRKPLSNGDVIYNGTFDQGIAHVGGWVAAAGTTLKVPRYTIEKLADSDVHVVDVASTKNSFEALTNGGEKYYERRAQISAESGKPVIYQKDLALKADSYALNFDLYSKAATTAQAAIYSGNSAGELGTKLLESPVVNYKDAGKVKNYSWKFTTPRALSNAALVLTFGEGTSVQLDNVTMIGQSQAEVFDPTPVNSETEWNANGADGGSVNDFGVVNGAHIFNEIKSGANWYSPQITSSQFKTGAGSKYQMSVKLKLEGESNNKVSYIVQNQGSWEVIKELTEIDLGTLGAPDADGFYTYTAEINCPGNAYNNVALNFGLGNSAANNATFYFKDVTLTLVTSTDSGSDSGEDMGETKTGIAINYVLGAEDAKNADANPFYYTKGTGKITLEAPVREGYIFDGWTLTENSTDYITEVSTDTDAITVYAHWTAKTPETKPDDGKKDDVKPDDGKKDDVKPDDSKKDDVKPDDGKKDDSKNTETKTTYYKVTFKSNGGSAVKAQTVAKGKKAAKPKDPTRKGYKFVGWYAGSKAYNFSSAVTANKTLTAKWKVIKVSKITITGSYKQIAAGKKIKLKAVVSPKTAKNCAVTWKTSNKKYATVSSKGVVTVKKAGAGKTVTITATAKDGSKKKATYKIKIMKNAVKKIKLKAAKSKVKAGKKGTVKATVTPTKQVNKKLTWKTSNKKYATVNSKGVVTTKKAGKGKTVTITAYATDGSGKKATCKIKITK